jgi:predicted ATPase/GAF domain-containing protein/anti-anti-sigma regulatory factor
MDRGTSSELLGGYRGLEQYARTPFATWYRGAREADGAGVIIKVLRVDYGRVADIVRFKHEYERIRRVDSEGVVRVVAVEERAEGMIVVLEAGGGRSLSAALSPPAPLPAPRFLDLALGMTRAVRDLHDHGIVHGNINPGSILCFEGDEVKVWEFGADFAITHEDDELYAPTTQHDRLPYVAPEQTGRMNRGVDRRADLYSLGVMFYEMLTGRRPFHGQDPLELIHAHLAVLPEHPARLVPSLPPVLCDVVTRLLQKNAEDRYQTAAGLLADLEQCRAELRAVGRIESFPVGLRDRSDLFQIREKLYGREEPTARLVSTCEEALGGARKIVVVKGYSGIGKSSLVQEILRPLARAKGYYVSGKYDQYRRDTPYSAVVQAFDALVRQILCESEERAARFREEIRRALSDNVAVVCEVVPSLVHLVGEQAPAPVLGPLESRNRFMRAFQRFVSVFARPEHPVAIFLDDLQWVDAASLGLLRALLEDGELGALFFCGAYRDNEVSPSHPFLLALGDLRKAGIDAVTLELAPLGLDHVVELVRDTLCREDVLPLAELVHEKTGGNPFFVKRFLRSLHDDGALRYDLAGGWQWDEEAIAALGYTDNVVDLLARTLTTLPERTLGVLRLAAAIGSRFDLATLAAVSDRSPEETYGLLSRAIADGFVVEGQGRLRFVHDKVQEAAYSLIPEPERGAIHHRIGSLLVGKRAPSDASELFEVVGHMNSAGDNVRTDEERIALGRLDLEAATRAEESAAFAAALRYVDAGLGFVRELQSPRRAEDLLFALTTKRGLVLSLLGRHDEALAALGACLGRAERRVDRTNVLRLRMSVHTLKNDLPAALIDALVALRAFGIELPPFPEDAMLDAELDRARNKLEGFSVADLTSLPRLEDPEIETLQSLLEEMLSSCYFLESNNYGITVARMVEHTLEHGISSHSIYAYVNFGVFLCGRGDVDMGYRLGDAARVLKDSLGAKKSVAMFCNMWGAFVQHWKEPYLQCKESFREGVQMALATGQYVWAFYNANNVPLSGLLHGEHLGDVTADARSYLDVGKHDPTLAFAWLVPASAQVAQNLVDEVPDPERVRGSFLDMDRVIAQAKADRSRATLFFTDFYTVYTAVFSGKYLEAARVVERAETDLATVASYHMRPAFHFYGGVSLTQACASAPPEIREGYLARARSFAERLARWAEHCPRNLRHRSLLLDAELARLAGEHARAGALYDDAVRVALDGGHTHDAALGNELCGMLYMRLDRPFLAAAYIAAARALYARWGAGAAVARLSRVHPALDAPSTSAPYPNGGARDAAPARSADVYTILKASQGISGEVVFPRLLGKLMSVILETAGARRGLLVLAREDKLSVEADAEGARVELVDSAPLTSIGAAEASVIRHVALVREPVVIGDARREASLASAPYLANARARSILAAPILLQGRLLGVIYLENDLAAFAFTEGLVDVLRILAAQAAVSLENARLFGELEERVEERTKELREANDKIEALYAARELERGEELREKAALIERQEELIRALSAPVIKVWDGVLAVPLIGAIVEQRASTLMDTLLAQIANDRVRFAILDMTGVTTVDAQTAELLVRVVRAVELLGVRGIVTGLRSAAARALIGLGVDLGRLSTYATLREGLKACMRGLAQG